jgi:DNA modification methylase
VRDRLNTTYEVVYFLIRSPSYYFALDDIRQPYQARRRPATRRPPKYAGSAWAGALAGSNSGLLRARSKGRAGHPLGKNPGDVWTMATAGYRGAHFATFPETLVERPLAATCPERVCGACGQPWRRPPGRSAPVPGCACKAAWRPGVVLDPFFGSGTVGVVAERLERDWIGIELNPAYAALAEQRIAAGRAAGSRNQPEAA